MTTQDSLAALAAVIESRKVANGGDPDASYVARLLHRGPDAFLKKIGEEATEVVMAAKDADHGGDKAKIVGEVADLWFHSMIALAHYGLSPADVIAELQRRVGTSGIEEKALRKAIAREQEKNMTQDYSNPNGATLVPAPLDMQRLQSLNTIGTISYVLHLIVAVGAVIPGGQFGPVLLIAALVIDMVKRSDAEGTWHASHFSWRIRTVLIAGLLYLLTAPLFLLLFIPGWIAWTVISIWFLYRIVTGFMAMNRGESIGNSP